MLASVSTKTADLNVLFTPEVACTAGSVGYMKDKQDETCIRTYTNLSKNHASKMKLESYDGARIVNTRVPFLLHLSEVEKTYTTCPGIDVCISIGIGLYTCSQGLH